MSGQKHGWGKYSWPSGATYLGEWKHGSLHGYGTFHSPDGSRYQGNWENNLKNGIGTKWHANGDRYEGLYRQDKPHGPGRFLFASGDEFDGEFRDGKFHGQGTFKWISKHRYDGEWYQGMQSGIGVFTWPDGGTYEGFWQIGLQHGIGVFRPARKSTTAARGTAASHIQHHNTVGNMIVSNTGAVASAVAATANAAIVQAPAAAAAAGAHMATSAFHHLSDPKALFSKSLHSAGLHPPQPLPQPPHAAAASPPISRPGSPTHAPTSPTTTTAPTTTTTTTTITAERENPSNQNTNTLKISTAVYACEYRHGDLILEEALQPEDLDYVFGTATRSRKFSGGTRKDDGGHIQGNGTTLSGTYNSGVLPDGKGGVHGGGTAWKLMARQSLVRRRRPKKEERMGETIFKGSPSFDLMLNLQLGIRYTLTTLSKLPPLTSPLEKAHFEEKVWLKFPRQGSEVTPPHPSNDFKWKDYSPLVFRQLRGSFGISNSEYILSTCGDHALRELPSPGKSGSVFFVSQDERFIIKTMRKEEVKLLLRTLPLYYAHVSSHPDTLISRFYGIHRITLASGRKVRFVVMNNIFATEMPLHKKYDLKGSTYKRTASTITGNSLNGGALATSSASSPGAAAAAATAGAAVVILKDLDLTTAFELKRPVVERLQRQLAADAEFLQAADVMDYSLLLGVHYRTTKTKDHHPGGSSSGGGGGGGNMDSNKINGQTEAHREESMENSSNTKRNITAPIDISSIPPSPEDSDAELITPGSSFQYRSESAVSTANQQSLAALLGGTSSLHIPDNFDGENADDDGEPLIIHNSMSFSAKMIKNQLQQQQQQQQQQPLQVPVQQLQQPLPPKLPGVGTGFYINRFMAWRRDTKEKKRQKAEQASGLGIVAMAPPPTPAPPPLSLDPLNQDGGVSSSGGIIPPSPSLSASSGGNAIAVIGTSPPYRSGVHRRTTSATAAVGGSMNSLFSSPAAFQLGIAGSASTAPSSPLVGAQQRPGSGPLFRTNSTAARGVGNPPSTATKGNKNSTTGNSTAQHHLKVTYSDQLMEQHAALVASLANWGEKNKIINTTTQQQNQVESSAAVVVAVEAGKREEQAQKNSLEESTIAPVKQPVASSILNDSVNDENSRQNNNDNEDNSSTTTTAAAAHINYRADAVALPIDSSVVEPTTPSSARVSNVFTRTNFSTTGTGMSTGGEVFVTPFALHTPPTKENNNNTGGGGGGGAATNVPPSSPLHPQLEHEENTVLDQQNSLEMSYSEAFDDLSDEEAQAMLSRLTARLSKPIEDRLAFDLLRLARHKMLGASSTVRGGGGSKDGTASSRLPTAVLAAARHARFTHSNSLDRTNPVAAAAGGQQQQQQQQQQDLNQDHLMPAQSLSRHVPAIAIPFDPTPGILSAHTRPPNNSGTGDGSSDGDGGEDVALFLGVIDWLQPYNARKRLEHRFKSVVLDSKAISVCEPRAYAKRFLNLMKRVFVAEREDEKPTSGG